MERLRIEGGRPLHGEIRVHGAKNAALPILAATVLVEGVHQIRNVPQLKDISVMLQILKAIGCEVSHLGDTVTIDTTHIHTTQIPELLMRQMRSSLFLVGPLLARFGHVETFQPGGCAIGDRKIDIHLDGLRALGSDILMTPASMRCEASVLRGSTIHLPFPSVGATENIMMAAVLAKGKTMIHNAAREPEIVDLQGYLNQMGASVRGAGTSTIEIEGVSRLAPTTYSIIPDRIVAGTLLCAAVATKGDVVIREIRADHLSSLIDLLEQLGASITIDNDSIRVKMEGPLKAIPNVLTGPYPHFPTDLQAQVMVLLAKSEGLSELHETVFERRFQHVQHLQNMGAHIWTAGHVAYVQGVRKLYGRVVEATDLRAGAALIIAGLIAQGTTWIESVSHIDRGYEDIETMFSSLGAMISRVSLNHSQEQHVI